MRPTKINPDLQKPILPPHITLPRNETPTTKPTAPAVIDEDLDLDLDDIDHSTLMILWKVINQLTNGIDITEKMQGVKYQIAEKFGKVIESLLQLQTQIPTYLAEDMTWINKPDDRVRFATDMNQQVNGLFIDKLRNRKETWTTTMKQQTSSGEATANASHAAMESISGLFMVVSSINMSMWR